MANLIRTIDDPCPISPDDIGPADAEQLREWIVTNGLGGYASGTVCAVPTRRYHGLLDRRAAGAAGPHDHAQPAPGAGGARRRPLGRPSASSRWPAGRRAARVPRRRVPPRGRPAGLAVRGRRRRAGEAAADPAPPEHGLLALPPRRWRTRDPCSSSSGPWCISARTTRRWTRRIRARTASPPGATATRSRSPGRSRRLRMTLHGHGPGLHARRRADDRDRRTGWRRSAAIHPSGDQWSPGFFHAELTADQPVVLVASAESWETMLAMSFDEAMRAERRRRSRLLQGRRAANHLRATMPSMPSWCWRPTSS